VQQHRNRGDGSDEAHCSGSMQLEATSGRTITMEIFGIMHTVVSHDRDFQRLGHFAGKTFIKYSNEQGYEESPYTGVSFSGIRQPGGVGASLAHSDVRHKEWQLEKNQYNDDSAETVGLDDPHILMWEDLFEG